MKSIDQRLNNIVGQIEGIKKMREKKSDCFQVLIQLKAVRSAINGVIDSVVEEKLTNCTELLKTDDKKLIIKLKDYVKSN